MPQETDPPSSNLNNATLEAIFTQSSPTYSLLALVGLVVLLEAYNFFPYQTKLSHLPSCWNISLGFGLVTRGESEKEASSTLPTLAPRLASLPS